MEKLDPNHLTPETGADQPTGTVPVMTGENIMDDNVVGALLGIGFSEPLFGMHDGLLTRTRALIAGCECQHGCPTCVGPVGNTGPLAKTVALRILDLIAGVRASALPVSA